MSAIIKQVIVVRKDLNMRKGKMIAQGAHASLGAFMEAGEVFKANWFHTGQTKIAVGCDSEEQLKEIFHAASENDIPTYLVLDAGRTEFNEETYTAVALGPDLAEKIDKITGALKLL